MGLVCQQYVRKRQRYSHVTQTHVACTIHTCICLYMCVYIYTHILCVYIHTHYLNMIFQVKECVNVIITIRKISVGLMFTLCCDIDLIGTTCEQGVDGGVSATILPVLQTAEHLSLALWIQLLVSRARKEGTLCQTGNPGVCGKPESQTRHDVHRVDTEGDRAKGVWAKYGFNLEEGKKIINPLWLNVRWRQRKKTILNGCRGFAYEGGKKTGVWAHGSVGGRCAAVKTAEREMGKGGESKLSSICSESFSPDSHTDALSWTCPCF